MENLTLIKPEKVQNIINKFCYTIGMIPTSYKISMTYEEQIVAIGNYLETTIYPAINNNAEALAELQNAFIDLKNYIDNWINNLDISSEIDRKIEDMVQSGELTSILNSYLNVNRIYETVDDMKKDNNLQKGNIVKTLGYYNINDNGGNIFIVSDTKNESFKSSVQLNNNLFANIILKPTMNVKQFGFNENDEIPNITTFLRSLFNDYAISFIFRNLNFSINDTLSLRSNTNIYLENTTITNISNINKTYVFSCNSVENINIKGLNSILKFNKPETSQQACIEIYNSKNININNLTLFKAGGDGIIVSGTSNDIISENVNIENCLIDNNRRNGISLVGRC